MVVLSKRGFEFFVNKRRYELGVGRYGKHFGPNLDLESFHEGHDDDLKREWFLVVKMCLGYRNSVARDIARHFTVSIAELLEMLLLSSGKIGLDGLPTRFREFLIERFALRVHARFVREIRG